MNQRWYSTEMTGDGQDSRARQDDVADRIYRLIMNGESESVHAVVIPIEGGASIVCLTLNGPKGKANADLIAQIPFMMAAIDLLKVITQISPGATEEDELQRKKLLQNIDLLLALRAGTSLEAPEAKADDAARPE